MKQLDDLDKLIPFLRTENIYLSNQQISNLEKYLSELIHFSGRHRIVSRNDVDHIVSRHFLSSFYFVKEIGKVISAHDNILDIGSGAGFPGIILSIFFTNKVIMIDSVRKKTLFLNRVVKKLGLNCEIVNDRIENFSSRERRQFKIITARALAAINDLIDLTHPFLLSGQLHTIKGIDFKKENLGRENEIDLSFYTIDTNWVQHSDYLDKKVYITFTAAEKQI